MKIKKVLVSLFLGFIILFSFASYNRVEAVTQSSAPYETYTIGPKGRLVQTQTAYEPVALLGKDLALNGPSDIFVKDDLIYIVDTLNKRIVITNLNGVLVKIILSDLFMEPTGIFVSDSNIFIADRSKGAIIKLDLDGNFVDIYEKPTEPTFGKDTTFIPLKVVIGPRDNLYVVCESQSFGLVQLNYMGEFLGFFGSNITNKSFISKLADFFNVSMARSLPVAPNNVEIDQKGLVYTTSPYIGGLKKFNIASENVLNLSMSLMDEPVDVSIGNYGNIYTISRYGYITEYDNNGNMLFLFGGYDETNTGRIGLTLSPQAIEVDLNNNIYVLDKTKNIIHVFERSNFTTLVHSGIASLQNGDYNITEWNEVLKKNSMFSLANDAIGQANFRLGNYEEAMSYYLLSNNKVGYSLAFWQVRFVFMQTYLIYIIAIMAFLFVSYRVLKVVDHKYHIFSPVRKRSQKFKEIKIVGELLLLFKVFRHPIDTYYEIKHHKKSSILAATIIYLLIAVVRVISAYATAFIFNESDLGDYNIFTEIISTLGVILLFIVANYLISTLNSGEGWLKDIYISTAYALAPYLLGLIPLAILSHVLTYNETFLYVIFNFLMISFALIYLVVMVKEIHNYTIKELIGNLILTVMTMILIVVILFVFYMLFTQLIDFISGIIGEVGIRVSN